AAVGAEQHHGHADHGLAAAVAGDGAVAHPRGHAHHAEILHVHRRPALAPIDHDRLEILGRPHARLAADGDLLASVGQPAAAPRPAAVWPSPPPSPPPPPRPRAGASRSGSSVTSSVCASPPKTFTSTMPGTMRRRGEICQSRMLRSSIIERPSPRTSKWN